MKFRIVLLAVVLAATGCQKWPADPCAAVPEDMKCIPAGNFLYGSNDTRFPDEHPQSSVFVSTFYMDATEVTTAAYRQCSDAGVCDSVVSYYPQNRGDNQPQLMVTWFQAKQYCEWKGKRLPTEAEWEKAARGAVGAEYPWGNETADCSRAVIKENAKRGCTAEFGEAGRTSDIATRPAGAFGLYDMAGNAHEWVADWYHPDRKKCGQDCLGADPKGPCQGKEGCPGMDARVLKGGSWYWDSTWARSAKRRAYDPHNRHEPSPHNFGFRCAKSAILLQKD